MKGIVKKYIEDKCFGLITDENEEERFFHISEVVDKEMFLKNWSSYSYLEFHKESPKIVEFHPTQNQKGLIASKIELTNQVLNDKSNANKFKAIITDFNYDVESFTRIVQGIKKGNSAPFGSTAGSNGTYRNGYPDTTRELNLSFKKMNDIGWGKIDVRSLVLSLNNRKKITNSFVEKLRGKLIGKEVEIFAIQNQWNLRNDSILIS
jgi:cold shock CspA family protein